ncbi:isocitrate lyase/PEP mutase family protein [Cupriavidus basilensis]|uniref:Isocitrate lyase/PEP mutase family protein n=1 Tax=Cupriavidus basilensis TaxID=68895 RepID=A0ABT6B0D7_9BURK|nr:isocitrate lyase/PEP mutase family protein [Cupriavidus basilensis]MDF3838350.1 isocitrate lyase/PEP mutase family protein [Cupriavidus basilensis]
MQRISPAQKTASLRELLRTNAFIVAPAVHDIFSLRLVEQAGFRSACISGAMLSYSLLGIPDIGLLTLTECVEHCRRLTRASSIPITADGDAGYGNPRGVHYAVELFEEAGAAGLNIEDQVVPRRWGSTAGKEVVSVGEMVAKIDAARRARRDGNFLIIARTDAFACESTGQVIDRARAYQDAGADMLLPVAPRTREDIRRLARALEIPVTLSAGTGLAPGASCANVPLSQLPELGVRRASLTTLLPGASVAGMKASLESVQRRLRGSESSEGIDAAVSGAASLDGLFDAAAQSAFEAALLR